VSGYLATHIVDVVATDLDGAETVAAAGLHASILRQSGSGRGATGFRYDESSTPVTVRLPHGTPCTQGDQIRDTATGTRWLVDTATTNYNPVMAMPVVATCRDLDGGA